MTRIFGPITLAVLAAWASAGAVEAASPTKRVLTLDQALRVIDAGKAEAKRLQAGAVIAVVDDAGLLVVQERMDDPDMPASIDLAPGKARAAALFRKPTADLEKAIDGGRVAAVTARGFVEMTGGVPLVEGGQVVGAVGVSTATPQHDEAVAAAAAGALRD